jgi:hypothetical protein
MQETFFAIELFISEVIASLRKFPMVEAELGMAFGVVVVEVLFPLLESWPHALPFVGSPVLQTGKFRSVLFVCQIGAKPNVEALFPIISVQIPLQATVKRGWRNYGGGEL